MPTKGFRVYTGALVALDAAGAPVGSLPLNLDSNLVPRWNGDTNFMTVVGEVRVLPEELPRTGEKLRPIFQKLS